jgi:ubiquinone/menaquinone biosynthesis C-methylase UbiE
MPGLTRHPSPICPRRKQSILTPLPLYGVIHFPHQERQISTAKSIAEHWGTRDFYALITSEELAKLGKFTDNVTVEDLPVDHFHARGFPATQDLADRLPIEPGQHIVDIGCGLGGPARYIAKRFQCKVSGIDITPAFVDAGSKLTALVRMQEQVKIELGDGQSLPYAPSSFDGAYSQHVTMNVPDRPKFFAETWRVLKPGAFFALTEHGLGPTGQPHHPVPWSADGSSAYLVTPAETRTLLEQVGFEDIVIEDTGAKYLAGYKTMIEKAESGTLPPFGTHLLMGETALQKTRNAARNIEEGRTHPIQLICRKAG